MTALDTGWDNSVNVHWEAHRTDSTKFFSLFVVVLMWLVSLGALVIGVNFALSKSLSLSYDVPALLFVLLFALPFVREVQPGIPPLGISIDLMGFYFNMILIALVSVMVISALSNRFYKIQRLKVRAERGDDVSSVVSIRNGSIIWRNGLIAEDMHEAGVPDK